MVHHYVPTIHPFHRHFVNFPAPRCCHACSKSSHIATFGCSCPPCHPHPGVTPLQHWPQRPFFWEAGTRIGGPPPLSSYPWQCFAHAHMPTSISSQIMLHLDLPIHPCHSSTWGSLAHHWPQRPSFQLVGAPIKCPPPPPISLWYSVHAHTCAFRIQLHFHIWMHLSVFASHLGGLFHHKPALVAPLFLWVGYFLCAHPTHSSFSNFCTYMRTHSGQPGPHLGSMPTCTPFHAPPHTLHAIFSGVFLTPTPLPVPWHTSISIPWPMGREILHSGQKSGCFP